MGRGGARADKTPANRTHGATVVIPAKAGIQTRPRIKYFHRDRGSGSRIKCGMTEIIHNGQLNGRKAKKQN